MRIPVAPLLLCVALAAADLNVLEEIIVKVNGDIVTRTEIEKSRGALQAELTAQRNAKPEQLAMLREREKDILRDRIDQLLLIQKGKELSINVDPEITKQLAEIQKQANIADPDKFQAYVKEQTGMAFEDYKAEMRNSMLTQRVIRQEVGGRINIPRSELQAYYEQHKAEFVRQEQVFLREIFISTEGKDATGVAAADKKAKDLVARARKGEKFPELARDNSDSDTAKSFGELPPFKKEDLRADLVEAIWNAPRNFVTEPIKNDKGFLILKVEEHHQAGQARFEEVEQEIMERLYMPRFQPKIREYLTQLRQDAFLEIKEGWTDSGAAPGKGTRWTDPAQLKPETISKEQVSREAGRKRLLWAIPVPGTSRSSSSVSK
ncbi:MAG: peptidylprolyl isomerase [Acidobacteria bacterium]|nr:peptidylprolyl isomerase [Acidobacteriota bacterium]